MTTARLIQYISSSGVCLTATGLERLCVKAEREPLTDLLAQLNSRQREIIRALAREGVNVVNIAALSVAGAAACASIAESPSGESPWCWNRLDALPLPRPPAALLSGAGKGGDVGFDERPPTHGQFDVSTD
jgi:hypothetical protein